MPVGRPRNTAYQDFETSEERKERNEIEDLPEEKAIDGKRTVKQNRLQTYRKTILDRIKAQGRNTDTPSDAQRAAARYASTKYRITKADKDRWAVARRNLREAQAARAQLSGPPSGLPTGPSSGPNYPSQGSHSPISPIPRPLAPPVQHHPTHVTGFAHSVQLHELAAPPRYPYGDSFVGAPYRLEGERVIYADPHGCEYYLDRSNGQACYLNGNPYHTGSPQTHHSYSLSKHERRHRRVFALRMQRELGLL